MLARTLRRIRLEHRLTQADIGEAVDATQQAVNHWENGMRLPRTRHLLAFADAFEVNAEELLQLRDLANQTLQRELRELAT